MKITISVKTTYKRFQGGFTIGLGAREGVIQKDKVTKAGNEAGREIGKRKVVNGEKEEAERWGLDTYLSSPLN